MDAMEDEKTIRPEKNDHPEKTVRTVSNEEKTVRTGGPEKTMRQAAGNDRAEKTVRSASVSAGKETGAERTIRATDRGDKTERRPDVGATVRHEGGQAVREQSLNTLLQHADTYQLGKKSYQFKRVISDTTGEGHIYLVEQGGAQYALKLYFPNIHPDRAILKKIKSFGHSGVVVELFDYGTMTDPVTGQERDYELMEFLDGGTLDEIRVGQSAETLKKLMMQAAMSLDFCHQNCILHNDVKPGNYFVRGDKNASLVLGDFGIAAVCNPKTLSAEVAPWRTKTYAAPEIYQVIDERVEVTPKSDFYSLGIVLMCLWLGEKSFRENERLLVQKKCRGDLPFPTDMPADLLMLLRGLTIVDSKKRWGFEEVSRWFRGEMAVEEVRQTSLNILYHSNKKQTAHTPEELAGYMLEDEKLAVKYLYSGKVAEWFFEGGMPELGIEIEEIVERKYPKNQHAGFLASVYRLDVETPYRAADGKTYNDPAGIALALIENRAHYVSALAQPDDDLFVYLRANGYAAIEELVANFKKNSPTEALWQMIYTLDPDLPYYLECKSDSNKSKSFFITCCTPDDIIVAFRENTPTNDGWNGLKDYRMVAWLSGKKEPVIYHDIDDLIRVNRPKVIDKVKASVQAFFDNSRAMVVEGDNLVYAVIYLLNRQISYNLYLPEEERDGDTPFIFSPDEVALHLNDCLSELYSESGNGNKAYQEAQIENLKQFGNSRLYCYFRSKGWREQIDWVSYCFNFHSKENENKYGPYDETIAAYKAIKGLGYDPYYYFEKSKKLICSVEELNQVPRSEAVSQMKNGVLKEWLTIFYQENPEEKFTQKFQYERLTCDYLKKIEEYAPDDVDVKNFRIAASQVEDGLAKIKRRYMIFQVLRILFAVLCFAPVVAIAGSFLISGFPLDHNPLPIFSFWRLTGLTFLLGLIHWMYSRCDFGLLSVIYGLVSAVGSYYAVYCAFRFLPSLQLAALLLLLAYALIVLYLCYYKISSEKKMHAALLQNNDFESRYLEPLHFAFKAKAGSSFDSSIAKSTDEYARQLKSNIARFLKRIIPLTLFSCYLALLTFSDTPLVSVGPAGDDPTENVTPAAADKQEVAPEPIKKKKK